ncbi:putative metallophosphoesterase YhaO [Polystyrenella longa]|uniref:Putative metallophosphoesterase YhaO n=1 Tax=Polystyrenella longa TaxID=2528007 RepID=A0A518CT07_9PLAN|nr:DNA repair exonuclease [Polystyrenella longa]QDU82360.1 putative metallophosphoesterase YhaO [Polystyrenella longa]
MRFIHAADIHLDSPLKGLEKYEGAPVEEIRTATRRALENLAELAINEEVDFLIIAGDVYDGDWKDHNTGLFFVAQMNRLREADIPVVIISGNHDAANKMTRSLRLPDNVELLSHTRPATAKSARLAELGVAIHGRSFAKQAELENLVLDYPQKSTGLFNIGLLHTSLEGAEGHEPYAPCSVDHLKQKGYDYWALGHVHTRRVVIEDPPVVFPGNIQGRNIRETGEKGCYLVTADDQGVCDLQFLSLDVFRWEMLLIDATDFQHPHELIRHIGGELEKLGEQNDGLALAVRVEVTGATVINDALRAEVRRWTNELRATGISVSSSRIWVEKVKWKTTSPLQERDESHYSGPIEMLHDYFAELRQDESQLSELARQLDEFQRKMPDEIRQGETGLHIEDPEQIREWLNEIEPMLMKKLGRGGK